ncbi:MAG: hypothetical protein IKY62_04650 [Clostridia bacterium]|nr:hypothetical protein [Clostridia bacterium]
MEYYTKKYEIDPHDVDFNGSARASALMRIMQSTAEAQLSDSHLSYDELRDMSRAFILSRMRMEFTECVSVADILDGVTFPCHSQGYSFIRCYKLMRGEETVGRAVSVWALVDTNTRSLVKVNDFDLGITTYTPLDYAITRFVVPKNISEVGKYRVDYSVTDRNRHLNNTRYPDMYASFLDMGNKRIAEIAINYINEAPMGEILTVYHATDGDFHYFRTVREDGRVNSEAEIRLTDIK